MKILYFILIFVIVFLLSITVFYFTFFLRKPDRSINFSDDVVVSPANWRIVNIFNSEKTDVIIQKKHYNAFSEFIEDIWTWKKTIVSIEMTLLNVHWQRLPYNAKFINKRYCKWIFFNAISKKHSDKATFENEHNSLLFETDKWYRFKVIQIAWFTVRRIVDFIKIWWKYKKWDIIWLIKFWSQVSIVFDDNFEIVVNKWDYVIDWETVIAKIKK